MGSPFRRRPRLAKSWKLRPNSQSTRTRRESGFFLGERPVAARRLLWTLGRSDSSQLEHSDVANCGGSP